MSFHHGTEYNPRTAPRFEPDVLGTLTPTIIEQWMNVAVYGVRNPSFNAKPTCGRSSSLEYYKKAVSCFMPNKLMAWNQLTNSGNPTRSIEVNNLIKRVKKHEVRRTGKKSSARRMFYRPEVRLIIRKLRERGDFEGARRFTAMITAQTHLIGRGDDISNLRKDGLRDHPDFDFALSQEVRWSKNVLEERNCPPQIMLGANDPDFCVLLAHAIYLELWCSEGHGADSEFLYADGPAGTVSEKTADRAKARYQSALRSIISDPEFKAISDKMEGELGSHSLRKFAAQMARENGSTMDDIEIRGRWKGAGKGRRMVGRYVDPQQAFVDTKTAAALCVGGAIKYKCKSDAGLTKDWIRANVVKGISDSFGNDNKIADVLGPVLLWACFEPTVRDRVPENIRTRVEEAFASICVLEDGVNPVQK
jgi:hypothetical protein